MRLPRSCASLDDLSVRCLIAVLNGARSVREVGSAVEVSSTATVHERLCKLRDLGLIGWEQGKQMTIRPRCEVAA